MIMKKDFVKGHPLTENESKEVMGGYMQSGKDPHNWVFCPVCGHRYTDDELEAVRYDPASGLWGRLCMECCAFIEDKE